MTAALAVLAVLAAGLYIEAKSRMKHGWHRLAYRWHSGLAWHGQPIDPDEGWPWPGPWFWRLHRLKRSAIRWAAEAVVLADLACWVKFPQVTRLANITAGWVLAAGLLAAGVWLAFYLPHHRRFVGPLRRALHEKHAVGHRRPRVARDRSKVVVRFRRAFALDARERQAVVDTVVAKTGIESAESEWRLAGPAPMLTLTVSKPPPPLVTLAEVMPYIRAAKPDELVWGLGRQRTVVKSSLSGDSPHIGLSCGSGGGKSIAIRALIAQMLYHGAIALILDFKQLSQNWARDLPNVSIVRHPHEIHAALCWLGGDPTARDAAGRPRPTPGEVSRRNAVALAGADLEGNVHAIVGPRLIIAAEELNATMKALRAYWRQMRDEDRSLPVRSPALDAFDMVNLMGRQVLMNALYVGQKLSAKAVGGDGDVRESIGVLAMGRYRPSTWKQLAEDRPMPPATRKPGRFQIVAEDVSEVQGIRISAVEARELALAGVVSPLPAGMPGAPRVAAETYGVLASPDLGLSHGTATVVSPAPELVTLRQAVDEGVVARKLHALRKASQRDEGFPEWVDTDGSARRYRAADLALWDQP